MTKKFHFVPFYFLLNCVMIELELVQLTAFDVNSFYFIYLFIYFFFARLTCILVVQNEKLPFFNLHLVV